MQLKVVQDHLMFQLSSGESLSCECIKDPYASQLVADFNNTVGQLRARLMNARNILRDGGYLYAKDIDVCLKQLDS